MSVFDEPLPCGGSYDCEGCPHEHEGGCDILIERYWIEGGCE